MSSPDEPIDIHELPGVLFRTSSIKKNKKLSSSLWQLRCALFHRIPLLSAHSWGWSETPFMDTMSPDNISYICHLEQYKMWITESCSYLWGWWWDDKSKSPSKREREKKNLHRCKYNQINMMNTEKDSVCQCCCPIFCFTHTSTGTLSSRGNTAPSSFKSIRRDSRRSMIVKAVRNKADRPESKRAKEQDWRHGNITNV